MKVTSAVLAILAFSASVFADAEAEPKKRWRKGLCGFPGMTCHKAKRAALAVSDALAAAEPKVRYRKGLCGFPGMTCHKARSALADVEDALDATVETVFERDADAAAEAAIRRRPGLCGYPGITCARSAEPEPKKKKKARLGLCGYPGITCARMKRGIDLIKEDDPEIFKDECFEEGGECHTVLKAAEAFHEAVKRDAEPEAKKKKWRIGLCGLPGTTCARDTHALAAAGVAGEVDFDEVEAECNGPEGDCTVVERSLQQLGDALDKAVEHVYKLE